MLVVTSESPSTCENDPTGNMSLGAPCDPAKLVLEYLGRMESRDLVAAKSYLSDDFEMVFPGGTTMSSLEDLVNWAAPRYRFVKKMYESTEVLPDASDAVVYTRGTLSGAWPDGALFSGIRFIDRFEVRNGKIARQDVWNDIAETRAS